MKNVSEICLKIDDIVKAQNIPFETYKQVNSLLCEIITTHNEKVGNVDDILKEVYLIEGVYLISRFRNTLGYVFYKLQRFAVKPVCVDVFLFFVIVYSATVYTAEGSVWLHHLPHLI